MRSLSSSSGGHSTSTAAAPPSRNDDVDQADDVLRRPSLSRGNNNIYTTANNNNNDMYKLFLSFAIIFIAVHQLLVHPLLLTMQTTSHDHNHHHSQALSKTCVETTERNIFHCTDTPTRIHRSDGNDNNNRQQPNEEQSGEEISQNNNKNKSKYRGVSQYISGSNEEMKKMAEVLHLMEEYWKKWMVNTASVMEEYDEINFLNIWYVGVWKRARVKGEAQTMTMCSVCIHITISSEKLHLHHYHFVCVTSNNSTNRHERCVFWASVGECEKNPVSPSQAPLLKWLF